MKISIIARTFDVNDNGMESSCFKDLELLIGRIAGICYMRDSYDSDEIQNEHKAMKRAVMISELGHHSVYDHSSITLLIEGIPKMLAMILNSTRYYSTSEKSARYTLMKPKTELENELYSKWLDIFKNRILDKYNDIEGIDDTMANKLAQENARYLISVFTPTIMAYTTTYRQWNYLIDWFDKLEFKLENADGFNRILNDNIVEFNNALKELFGVRVVEDNKNRSIGFLPIQNGIDIDIGEIKKNNVFGDVYSVNYKISLAGLAQAHRFRPINYKMIFNDRDSGDYDFYTPEILRDSDELCKEWISDINKVADVYPQGLLVDVLEQGLTEDFFLKCKERLCGRAQLEVMRSTLDTLRLIKENESNLSQYNRNTLNKMVRGGKYVPRCGFGDFECKGKCVWGIGGALTRGI